MKADEAQKKREQNEVIFFYLKYNSFQKFQFSERGSRKSARSGNCERDRQHASAQKRGTYRVGSFCSVRF